MAKVLLNVILVEGTDKQEFVDSFNADTEADWWNMLGNMPTLLVMNVEEDYIETFRSNSSVIEASENIEPLPASTPPSVEEMTKWFTTSTSYLHRHPSGKGEDNAPAQFIYDTNQITPSLNNSAFTVGRSDDQYSTRGEYTYKSRWTGKHVDIVTMETGNGADWTTHKGLHDLHPDLQKLPSEDNSHARTDAYWYQCTNHSGMKGTITVNPADGTRYSYTLTVTANGFSSYIISGSDRNGPVSGNNPALVFQEGDWVIFSVSSPGHPFEIRLADGGSAVSDGSVTNNGFSGGDIIWKLRTSSRFAPMDWPDLEDAPNNQVSTQDGGNSGLSNHGIGVLSAAGGTICGFAKKANLYAVYATTSDTSTEVINAIIDWHNNKPINPETGVKNPTIMIGEYQWLADRTYAISIDLISKINKADGTVVNRPGTSWGTDFSEFVEENIIPFKVYDPADSSYSWRVVMPWQSENNPLKTALDTAWNNGIVCINAAGNNGGTFNKRSRQYDTSLEVDSSSYSYVFIQNGQNNVSNTSSTTTWYPFIAYGPHGVDSNIDVAAGYNSEEYPCLDGYSNRGPGIDIIGLGASTWTSYQSLTFGNYKWGLFSGTSCATPTVVGKAACIMEEYFWYNGSWPTADQTKKILLAKAKNKGRGISSGGSGFSWSNVPSASGGSLNNQISNQNCRISDGLYANGAFTYGELTGTTNLRAYFDPQDHDSHPFLHKIKYHGKRPSSGMTYPRVNNSVGRHRMNLPDMT